MRNTLKTHQTHNKQTADAISNTLHRITLWRIVQRTIKTPLCIRGKNRQHTMKNNTDKNNTRCWDCFENRAFIIVCCWWWWCGEQQHQCSGKLANALWKTTLWKKHQLPELNTHNLLPLQHLCHKGLAIIHTRQQPRPLFPQLAPTNPHLAWWGSR